MQCSPTTSYTSHQKPVNIFYVWYSELCRRLNCNPTPVVKPAKPKCQTVLDFVADRLKPEEWNPVLTALRHDTSLHVISIRSRMDKCSFLHEIDSDQKVRQLKRRGGLIWTAYIMKVLVKSVTTTIKNTQVLTCLEFDGIPMFNQYLEPLMKALRNNDSLKTLSLSRCKISDVGCQLVCAYVRFSPNISVLNLSCCGLTAESGVHLAKLIKYQQINRYCESWHNSLRYSDPNHHVMRGIKRITLNGNPFFGDDGLIVILNVLDDDLWLKALDMQKCGITENISMRILDVVEYNQSLEIVDFRMNDQLHISTIEKLLTILKRKHQYGPQPEFQWCNTTLSLTCDSYSLSTRRSTVTQSAAVVPKSKSAPIKAPNTKISASNLRKSKTSENIAARKAKCAYLNHDETQRKVQELSSQLQEEIAKRREAEKINVQLKQMLDGIRINVPASTTTVPQPSSSTNELKTLFSSSAYGNCQLATKNGLINAEHNTMTTNGYKEQHCNGVKRNKDGVIRTRQSEVYHSSSNAQHSNNNEFSDRECESSQSSKAPSLIFKTMMDPNCGLNGTTSTPCFNRRNDEVCYKVDAANQNGTFDSEASDSQISLKHFIETLKCNANVNNYCTVKCVDNK